MIDKRVKNAQEAIQGITDGMTLIVGGFGLSGIPENSGGCGEVSGTIILK